MRLDTLNVNYKYRAKFKKKSKTLLIGEQDTLKPCISKCERCLKFWNMKKTVVLGEICCSLKYFLHCILSGSVHIY